MPLSIFYSLQHICVNYSLIKGERAIKYKNDIIKNYLLSYKCETIGVCAFLRRAGVFQDVHVRMKKTIEEVGCRKISSHICTSLFLLFILEPSPPTLTVTVHLYLHDLIVAHFCTLHAR